MKIIISNFEFRIWIRNFYVNFIFYINNLFMPGKKDGTAKPSDMLKKK